MKENREIIIISAVANDNAIGKDGKIPWDNPADRAGFRAVVEEAARLNFIIVCGRKTYTTLAFSTKKLVTHVLYDRTGILNQVEAILESDKHVLVIGGASVYEQFAPYATDIILSRIYQDIEGADAFFPSLESFPETIKYHQPLRNKLDDAYNLGLVKYEGNNS